ncbi:MAG: hypothetical protein VX495_00300 [Nitrospinota bacterium]|nr:hypothetical protein [Nitrospinota bacterium]
MKSLFLPVWMVAFVLLTVLVSSLVLAADESAILKKSDSLIEIPKEPGWNHPSYRGWESMSVPGLVATYYDLDLDSQLDYMVIRKVIRKASAEETTIAKAIEIAKFDDLSIFFSHPVVYFTNRNPLFYCMGVDYRRNCQDIWVDIAEDGLNGNEETYTLSTPSLGVR